MSWKVSDVFVESAGGDGPNGGNAFVESPGYERTGDGRFPFVETRSIIVRKRCLGFSGLDLTEGGIYVPTSSAQPRQYYRNQLKRYLTKTEGMTSEDPAYVGYNSTFGMSINPNTSVPTITGHWIPGNTLDGWDTPSFGLDILFYQEIETSTMASLVRQGDWFSGIRVHRTTSVGSENLPSVHLAKVNGVVRGISISDVRNRLGQAVTWGTTWQLIHNATDEWGFYSSGTSSFNEWSGPVTGDYYNPGHPYHFSRYDGRRGEDWVGINVGYTFSSAYGLFGAEVAASKTQVRGFVGDWYIASGYSNQQTGGFIETGIIAAGKTRTPLEIVEIPLPDGDELPPEPGNPATPLFIEKVNYLVRS